MPAAWRRVQAVEAQVSWQAVLPTKSTDQGIEHAVLAGFAPAKFAFTVSLSLPANENTNRKPW